MKTEPSEPIKVKLERRDESLQPNTHFSVKQESKVNFDFKQVKISHDDLEIGPGVSKVTRVRKTRRKIRKVSTRKGPYSKVKRKTKGRRRKRTTKKTTKTTKGRRKRTTKPLVTGKALTPRARLCKKLGIERNLSHGIHSLPTIRKMTQENLNQKRTAAGIGVLSIFGSELNSHGSVPLRDDHPDLVADLSGVDDSSPLAEQEDSYGPQLPPEDVTLNDNINTNGNINDNITNNINSTDGVQIENNIVTDNTDHKESKIDVKPKVEVVESQNDRPASDTQPKDRVKKPSEIEEGEIAETEGDSKSKIRRCKHGKLIHSKKHSDSSKSKSSSSKDKKEEPKPALIKTIKKEPRDRDEDRLSENRETRDRVRASIPNRHEIDYRRLNRLSEERTSKYRESDGNRDNRDNRDNHFREDRHSDRRKHRSISRERLSPLPPPPPPPLLHPPPPSSSTRSRLDDNSSKHRSSHKRDSSKSYRSPVRKESRRTSPHHEPYESKNTESKRKYDPEEEEKSKGKKKKKKHKHKHGKHDEEEIYNNVKNSKNHDSTENHSNKRAPVSSNEKMGSNNSRHHDHHHKKSKHRHHSRDGRSSPSSHRIPSPHGNDRDEKPNLSRSKSKKSRHSSPTREHISNRAIPKEERKESKQLKGGKVSSTVNLSTDEVNTKEIKVKTEDNPIKDQEAANSTTTSNTNTANSNKIPHSPSEMKSVLSKPGSPPKKDVRLVSKSRTEFDIFWDENSQNKKVDSSQQDYNENNEVTGVVKEETGLRFLPRTLLSNQTSPSVCLPPTVGPRTPPDEERTEKNVILSSPDQTMPTPTQDESLEGDYSNGSPSKKRSSIKSLNSPSIDPDIYDPEAPLDSPEDDQLLKSEIARSQSKLSEMEKKSSPCAKQISPVKNVPRPETPELPSPRSPHTNQHKFKSPNSFNIPTIPPISSTTSSNISRVPTLAESSLPPAPGSLLAQIQKTLNIQTKTHSSHSDSKQLQSHQSHQSHQTHQSHQSHQTHSGSTGFSSTSSTSSFIHPTGGSSGNDSINKTLAPQNPLNSLSPSLKSLLENLIKAAEQQQSKTKPFKTSVASNANSIFKKPAPISDSKSRSNSHSHHHSVKTKVIDKEATKKAALSINQGTASGSVPSGPNMKITDVAVLDEMPSSAVELQVKEKYLKKLNRQERVVEEVKMVLKPFYQRKEITKDEYKEIMRKAVPKICHSKSGEINPQKIRLLVEGYINRFKHDRKKSKGVKGK